MSTSQVFNQVFIHSWEWRNSRETKGRFCTFTWKMGSKRRKKDWTGILGDHFERMRSQNLLGLCYILIFCFILSLWHFDSRHKEIKSLEAPKFWPRHVTKTILLFCRRSLARRLASFASISHLSTSEKRIILKGDLRTRTETKSGPFFHEKFREKDRSRVREWPDDCPCLSVTTQVMLFQR